MRTNRDDTPSEQCRPACRMPAADRRGSERRRQCPRRPEHQANEQPAGCAGGQAERRHAAVGASPDGSEADDQSARLPSQPNARLARSHFRALSCLLLYSATEHETSPGFDVAELAQLRRPGVAAAAAVVACCTPQSVRQTLLCSSPHPAFHQSLMAPRDAAVVVSAKRRRRQNNPSNAASACAGRRGPQRRCTGRP